MNKVWKLIVNTLFISSIAISATMAQNIGVNNPTPDPSAVLDITSTDKGLLVPRVALVSTVSQSPVTAPATGLVVFNTATAGAAPNNVTPGFYFWDGAKWTRFDTGNSGKDWSITGNAGTDTTVNFIGTTDGEDLIFRMNNVRAGRINFSNTSFGFSSLAGNVISIENSAFGVNSLRNLQFGLANTAVGFSSGQNLTSGSGNTFMGSSSGRDHVSGFQNTAIGALSMMVNSAGSNNVAVGYRALANQTSGNANVAVGMNAMGNASNSFNNSVAVGDSALIFNSASGVTAVGSKAGHNNTSGVRNTFIGFESGRLNSLGSGNTALGNLTLRNAIASQSNVAIGDSAMFSTTSGGGNVAVGSSTGVSLTTGSSNTFIGLQAGRSVALGSANTFVGSVSGRFATSSFNSFFGQFSGANVTSGQGNVIIGHSTASGLTSGNNTTVLGWRSGQNLGSGSYNTLLGDSTNVAFGSLTNATALGSKAFVSGSNKMVLGSVAGTNGATSNVDVGIGTINPQQRLHVVGSIRMNDGNEAAGKVMVSDANGTGSWQKIGQPTYYTVKGTTNAGATTVLSPLPQMTITLTPQDSIVFVHFGAAGFSSGCGQGAIFFKILLNGTVVLEAQTSNEDISNITNRPVWDINMHGGIAVTPNVAQTISVSWFTPGCGGVTNLVASPAPPFGSYRVLTVVDPAGPGGASGSPVTTSDWSVTGNVGLSLANFIGTVDNMPLQFRQNNARVGFFDGFNVFLGSGSGISHSTGSNNTFVGRSSGSNHSVSLNNTFIGALAGFSNTSGNFNTFVGSDAGGNSLNTGTLNSSFGFQAGRSNNGNQNTFLGANAGFTAVGDGNVYIGHNAGTSIQGSNNISIGNGSAGSFTNTTGSNNIYIGPNTGDQSFVASNSVVIGANATFSASNSVVLGAISGIAGATVTHNVGIGTSAPVSRLHVRNNGTSGAALSVDATGFFENNNHTYVQLMSPAANESGVIFGHPSQTIGGGIFYNNAGLLNGLIFRSGSTNRMFLDASGNVGIGVAAPSERLEVAGNVNSNNGDFYGGSLNGVINMGGGIMNPLINIIADVTPTPLNANGDEDLYIADDIELGGQGFKPGGGSWAAASDARLKKDVQPFSDGLDKVLAIKPVSFKYNDRFKHLDNGKTYIGVIAQEIKEVAPYTVELMPFGQLMEEDENGVERVVKPGENFYSYDSSALTYMLINAVKELKSMNDSQAKAIEELKKEIEMLKGR